MTTINQFVEESEKTVERLEGKTGMGLEGVRMLNKIIKHYQEALEQARYSTSCEGIVEHECRYEGDLFIPCEPHRKIEEALNTPLEKL